MTPEQQELRLECLRLALAHANGPLSEETATRLAGAFYDFVTGEAAPASAEASTLVARITEQLHLRIRAIEFWAWGGNSPPDHVRQFIRKHDKSSPVEGGEQ